MMRRKNEKWSIAFLACVCIASGRVFFRYFRGRQMQSRQLNRSAGTWKGTKLIATSPAVAAICDRLELDLVGVCSTSVSTIPERYEDLPEIGTAMSPDMEVIAS